MLTIRITRARAQCEDVPLPRYATEHSAGMDLCAAVDVELEIPPRATALVPTSISIELPPGYEAQVRPRSGLAYKHGITVLNTPGTIDADYRGEVGVILINHGSTPFVVRRGDRIAQLVVARVEHVVWERADDLSDTQRGEGGFGHTGVAHAPAKGEHHE